MKMTCLAVALIVLAAFTPSIQQNSFKPLLQLAGGTWKMKTKKGYTCEQWQKVTATELSGKGFKIAGADTTQEEQVQLAIKDGEIYYIPTVSGQNNGKPVAFKLTSVDKNTYIFSNAGHDYPQTVAYQLVSKDSINAWIDGVANGVKKRVGFHYSRVQ